MEMELFNMQMETNIQVNLNMGRNQVMVVCIWEVEVYIQESLVIIHQMALES